MSAVGAVDEEAPSRGTKRRKEEGDEEIISDIEVRFSHSWAQRKLTQLSPLSPLNILLSINGSILYLGFNN